MHYADTSALVKLAVAEAESAALVEWIAREQVTFASSDLARTELIRAVRRSAPAALAQAREVLARVLLVHASARIFDEGGRLDPLGVRSLDAVHLATALALGDDLESVVTYDERMAAAATALGLRVVAPA
ncbi:type II toxin-antitoxin system VapC family toxin [Microbacterium sp.]|uniref:type II toxin-antitoxin system VapC family toxin n=1 Tax=Microbacterium sp. TaxID=51671 RepID=UPI0028A1F84A|nr:type II toxin-antitoxin system VapC family toxin [Microbacterium sp.]